MRFVRTYSVDGVTFTCAVICDVRGPLIQERPDLEFSDVDCPRCLALVGERR